MFSKALRNVKARYDTSNQEEKRRFQPLPIGKNEKLFRFIKDEMATKIITKFAAVRPKTCSFKIQKDEYENITNELIN